MNATSVYPAPQQDMARCVDLFVDQAFRSAEGSLFTPHSPVWTTANLAELKRRFVDQPDETDASFDEKLKVQLRGASDQSLQLMAEMLYVYYMVAETVSRKTKIANVNQILGWMARPVAVPPELVEAAGKGLTNPGQFYLTNKPFQLWFMVHVGLAWRERLPEERAALLADPWAFKAFLMRVPDRNAKPMRMALLHFVFPDTFEIIISATHKRQICEAYPDIAPGEADEDRKLLAIKSTMPREPHTIYTFYRDDVERVWNPQKHLPPKPPPGKVEDASPAPSLVPENGSSGTVSVEIATTQSVADALLLDPEWLAEVREVLLERGQIVFHGPPGTGKTRIARELASTLATESRVHFVQFHPAYSYEEFIEGLRPKVGGTAQFEVRSGPLRRIAAAAEADPEHAYVLIIDEINRANLARVLGELVFLLEYRDTHVTLPYSGDRFSLPRNLYVIGTMNTADRSIALIDAAIRRRFAFFRLAPDCVPVNGVLAEWLDANAKDMGWVDELVHRANEVIQSPDHAIGPAFFMRDGLNEAMLERIWKWQVLPYLDEFLYTAPDVRQKLDLRALRNQTSTTTEVTT